MVLLIHQVSNSHQPGLPVDSPLAKLHWLHGRRSAVLGAPSRTFSSHLGQKHGKNVALKMGYPKSSGWFSVPILFNILFHHLPSLIQMAVTGDIPSFSANRQAPRCLSQPAAAFQFGLETKHLRRVRKTELILSGVCIDKSTMIAIIYNTEFYSCAYVCIYMCINIYIYMHTYM